MRRFTGRLMETQK